MTPNHPLRRATWVWPGDEYELHNTYAQFRRDFRLPRVRPAAVTGKTAWRLEA